MEHNQAACSLALPTVCMAKKKDNALRRRMGHFGESAAATYLIRQGYTILARQWRCKAGEIDLVVRHEQQEEQVVFVEVRTRRGSVCGSPEESLTPTKQSRLATLAYTYLEAHSLDETIAFRIDVIAIELDQAGRIIRLNHIMNAIVQ